MPSIGTKNPVVRAILFGIGFILSVPSGGAILMMFDSYKSDVLGISLLFAGVVCVGYFADSMGDII